METGEKRKRKGVGEKKLEIICPPNSWSKTHSTVMESNSIPAQQVSIHEVNAKKKKHTQARKKENGSPYRSLKSKAGETHKLDNKGHIKPCVEKI